MNRKSEKGIGLTDAIIAVVILMMFAGLVVSISYNIYLKSAFIKRNEFATEYISGIFEYANQINFDDVTEENLVQYINNKNNKDAKAISQEYAENSEKIAAYSFFITVDEKYENYIKQVNVTTLYKLGLKNKTLFMSTLINK